MDVIRFVLGGHILPRVLSTQRVFGESTHPGLKVLPLSASMSLVISQPDRANSDFSRSFVIVAFSQPRPTLIHMHHHDPTPDASSARTRNLQSSAEGVGSCLRQPGMLLNQAALEVERVR